MCYDKCVVLPVTTCVKDMVSVDHSKESSSIILSVQFVSDLLQMELP